MKKLFVFVGFLAVFGAGFGSGLLATKKKYEKRSDAEIASVRSSFQKHLDEMSKSGKIKDVPPTRRGASKKKKEEKQSSENFRAAPLPSDPIVDNYKNYSAPYSLQSKSTKQPGSKEHQKKLEPYVISPDEYMSSEYIAKSLIYYSDKVLADDDDNVIPNPTTLLGKNALTSFGQYEDDSVYVRDDNLKTDYEILLSQKTFNNRHTRSSNPKQSLQSDDNDE